MCIRDRVSCLSYVYWVYTWMVFVILYIFAIAELGKFKRRVAIVFKITIFSEHTYVKSGNKQRWVVDELCVVCCLIHHVKSKTGIKTTDQFVSYKLCEMFTHFVKDNVSVDNVNHISVLGILYSQHIKWL